MLQFVIIVGDKGEHEELCDRMPEARRRVVTLSEVTGYTYAGYWHHQDDQ